MPLPYAFVLLRTADLRLDPADRTVLQFPLLERGQPAQRSRPRDRPRIARLAALDFVAAVCLQELEGFL